MASVCLFGGREASVEITGRGFGLSLWVGAKRVSHTREARGQALAWLWDTLSAFHFFASAASLMTVSISFLNFGNGWAPLMK